MSKQTAVEWLIKKLQNRQNGIFDGFPVSVDEIYDEAQAMEREQRFQDFKEGFQAAFDSLQGANNLVQSKKFKGGEQ